jgi:hypothetical protein
MHLLTVKVRPFVHTMDNQVAGWFMMLPLYFDSSICGKFNLFLVIGKCRLLALFQCFVFCVDLWFLWAHIASIICMLMQRYMIKTELNSCIIYVIGEHMLAVTVLYLIIGTKQCQFTCSLWCESLIFCTSSVICNWCYCINHATTHVMTRGSIS